MSQEPDVPRSGGMVPSRGIESSFIWLAVGIVGLVFLFFLVLGTKSDDKSPAYENGRQINPPSPRNRRESDGKPELGAPEKTESS
ncbi:MAG: hypothetical protein ACKV2Q_15920 [Planctomycetaceae bacterium]